MQHAMGNRKRKMFLNNCIIFLVTLAEIESYQKATPVDTNLMEQVVISCGRTEKAPQS